MNQLIFEQTGGICRLRLNRPERRNAWSAELGGEMLAALQRIEKEPTIRCVVISGEGGGFCAGVDLRDGFDRTPAGDPDLRGMHRRSFAPVILSLRALPVPVITAVHGPAVGFGASLAMAGDFLVMSSSAQLIVAFVRLGLSPDSGTTAMLPPRVGRQRATEAAMLGEPIPAERAVEWGIAHRAVPDQEFEGVVDELAARLAAGPTRAYAAMKRAFDAGQYPRLAEQLELEGELVHSLGASADFAEGVAAFLEKRPARFTGE